MASLFRPQYTAPIPEGAQSVTHKGKPAVRFKDADGKAVVAPLTKKGHRIRLRVKTWYGKHRDADGIEQSVPLSENRIG